MRDDCKKVINEAWSSAGTTELGLRCMKKKISRCGSELQA